MRNLRNVRFGRWSQANITATCWDPEYDETICAVGPTETSARIELLRVSEKGENLAHELLTSWDSPSPSPDLLADTILSLQYQNGTGSICIVLEGGDIVSVSADGQVEIMGSIDSGIAAARWSPDEELLIIVTKEQNVLFLGSSFDPVAEVPMLEEDLKLSKQVSVGWGKRETQFEGRGAKALRDPTIPLKVDSGVPSKFEDGATTISWRGDGAFVAINSVAEGSRRVIRAYSREGELDSASEAVDGLESALSWRPAGNLMASIQRLEDRVDVVFFERNGLRHGEFTLVSPVSGPIQTVDNIRLEWNADSTVLAVVLQSCVQLWTMGNYHWYLKEEIPVRTKSLSWHSEKALRLALASSDSLLSSEYAFHTAKGSCHAPYDNGAVAVIDGTAVKLTPFATANVPPPMALYDVPVESSVIDVAFGRQNLSFAVLHHKGVSVFDWSLKNGRPTKPSLLFEAPFSAVDIPGDHMPLRICCASETTFRISSYQQTFELELARNCLRVLADRPTLLAFATHEDESGVQGYGQDRGGKLYRLEETEDSMIIPQFPTQLPFFEVTKVDEVTLAFGLSRGGHLYANSRSLAKNCTSFVVTPSHLIFTTNNHFVKFVHLASNVDNLEVPSDDLEKDERCRSVERGSRLVTAIPTNMSIVLQMPRGNLETIFPRAMVVAGIRNLIEEKNYGRAFSYCRTQRVDMNILYDHQPEQFMANVGLFLDQLKEVAHIDLFLSALRAEDVTQTMYENTKQQKPSAPFTPNLAPRPASSKINTICDSVLKALQSRKASNLQNIITAHVCKDPPALDDGLRLVADLMQEDDNVAERAVEHICFLVDVHRLYDHALGLYNLDLALLVAQQSQRDPREYVPFIQDLHQKPELRRKFAIDDHLSRHTKALTHLQSLNVFDELCDYTAKHALYHEALRLYRYDTARLNILTDLYAAYLESISQYREAGLAYESLQNYKKATSCYQSAGALCWQECLFSAQQQPLGTDAMADLANTLADALWESKDYEAAATIHLDYLASVEAAIRCLCKGYHFPAAIRLVIQRGRPELLTTAVDAGLAEALGSTTEFLADCKAQLTSQLPRIAELRRKAAEDPLSFYEGDRTGGMDIPDDVSIAASSRISTSASLFTRYTGKAGSIGTLGTGVSRASSKNRKREEKKRARGRKGTVYEEEYLCNSVRRLIERVMATKSEVERLVFALVRRGMAERARAAEALMGDVVAACERAVHEVFPPRNEGGVEPQQYAEAQAAGGGGSGVFQEFVVEGRQTADAPLVTGMKRLQLLGS
ncbi:Elongator complex protein-like protein [Emericellopsis cladophorae]|uniref:Elongator complex protein 1 n=1 Tax=Emericellopsis cladophorae TaxID=2686198 RepID=A0A9Q0BE66_9HYPO|nr:Elongator complex protein-like protein [Emericellopsis cladophorae]KAI6781536.1 Elongator complex protein-like protein [Emericellopsis cladophorae]